MNCSTCNNTGKEHDSGVAHTCTSCNGASAYPVEVLGMACGEGQMVQMVDREHVDRLALENSDIRLQAGGMQMEIDELREEVAALRHWRDLALQFDNHRMQALGHLKALLYSSSHAAHVNRFLAEPPMAPHEVVAERESLRSQLETMTADRDAEQAMKVTARQQRDTATAEVTRLRAGGQVSRGEMERLEEFKRQVRENRR